MPYEFKLPDVGEGVAEGELVEWHVEPGDAVSEDQVVAEVETDKAVVDVPSPVNGTVRELLADPGQVVPVGDVIITFDVEGEAEAEAQDETTEPERDAGDEAAAAAADEAAGAETPAGDGTDGEDGAATAQRGGRIFAPPSVRRLARELGVDVAAVAGSGPSGRVTEADVRGAAESAGSAESTTDETGDGAADGSDGSGLKSAVSKLGDDGDGESGDSELKSAVSRIGESESAASAAGDGAAAGDGQSAQAAGVEPAGRDRTLAAPATRQLADDLDVDLDDVPATEERDGEAFVTADAVREYAEAQQAAQAADAAEVAAEDAASAGDGTAAAEGDRREPYKGVRRTIGQAMERSKFTAPHVTHHETVDATGLVAAREKLKPRAENRGVKLTYMPFVMKAVSAALDEHPILNTQLDEENEEIVYRSDRNVGVATATDAGLMVPVVEDVDEKGLLQLASETNELVEKARERSIAREEMQGGTFTITNFGAIGGEYATPIINYPETAILGLGAIEERPVAEDGEVVARETLPLSLSIDHRVVDGADAARFVATLREYLVDPTLLLLE